MSIKKTSKATKSKGMGISGQYLNSEGGAQYRGWGIDIYLCGNTFPLPPLQKPRMAVDREGGDAADNNDIPISGNINYRK